MKTCNDCGEYAKVRRPYPYGFPNDYRCEKCDIAIQWNSTKGQKIIFEEWIKTRDQLLKEVSKDEKRNID